jgi:hypothetical protein
MDLTGASLQTDYAREGAELRHSFDNQNRDLSLEMWVEARAGIEPACKDLQSSA